MEGHGPQALDLFNRIAAGLGPAAGHAEPAAQFLELGADGAKLAHGTCSHEKGRPGGAGRERPAETLEATRGRRALTRIIHGPGESGAKRRMEARRASEGNTCPSLACASGFNRAMNNPG